MADQITTLQQRAITTLIEIGSAEEAAQLIGVSRQTIDRWLNETAFHSKLRQEQQRTATNLAIRLNSGVECAVAVIEGIMNDPATPVHLRLHATDIYLTNASKLFDMSSLEEQTARLDKLIEEAAGINRRAEQLEPPLKPNFARALKY